MSLVRVITLLAIFSFTTIAAISATNTAYYVEIESSLNSKITMAVPQLEVGEYQVNAIYVKTKQKEEIQSNRFVSDVINMAFEGIEVKQLNKLSSSSQSKIEGTPADRLYLVEYGLGVDSYDLSRELMKNPDIEYAVPVFNRYFTDFNPNDPEISKQWHIANLDAPEAWDITKGNSDIVIGIVDSGTDWLHKDLVDNIYTNPDEIPNNKIDDDNNGFIDDVHGWDFVGDVTLQQVFNGQFRPDNDPRPLNSQNSHGTHVAGCAAATTNNNIGIASIGFNTKILPVKCGSDNWGGTGTKGIFKGYQGIIYAAENGADIINCSWGGKGISPAEQEIINSVAAMGVLIVVSAGNEGENIDEVNFSPANYDNVLCVGWTVIDNEKDARSNYGTRVDIYAPGGNIYSTLPFDNYGSSSGTSMASPVAAGLAALVKAIHPDWTPDQIMAQLRSTTEPVDGANASNEQLLYGRINALNALTANSDNFSKNKVKGMAISETAFSETGIIDNYEEMTVPLKLINYLAPVDGVQLEFIAMDKYFTVNTTQMVVNGLATMDTNEIDLTLKLNELNPWYDGYARILVKYTSVGYKDYQLLKIPIEIKSRNKLDRLSNFEEENFATFYDIHTPSRGVVWAVGQNRFFGDGLIYNSAAGYLFSGGSDGLTGVYALDNNTAWATTATGKLQKTTNSGINWTLENAPTVTNFYNGIYFFDDNNGVAFGDGQGGQFGVVVTGNGGTTWTKASTLAPVSGEGGLVGAHCIVADRVFFGTNRGRILRGRNFGKNWTVADVDPNAIILDIAFQDDKKGLAIYNDRSKSSDEVFLAQSNDGGLNWTPNRLDFRETLGITPVEILYNEASERIFIICEKGEVYFTEDMGSNWSPVLTQASDYYQRADISNEVEQFTMYGVGDASVSRLDFEVIPKGAKAVLTSLSGTSFTFDSTELNKANNNTFEFENDGDLTIYIDSVYYRGDGSEAFGFLGMAPNVIEKGETEKIIARFRPTEEKEYIAQLVIESNNDNGEIVIDLSGKGYKSITSVEYSKFEKETAIYPTPTTSNLNIDYNYDAKLISVKLISLSGSILDELKENLVGNLQFNMTEHAEGTYILQFNTSKGIFYKKVVKQ